MSMNRQIELAEAAAIPFNRDNLSQIVSVSKSKLNNWLTRHQLWQTHRGRSFHRHYTVRELFDLAGFAAMRDAGIPEKECARFVRNYGFYRRFLSPEGRADFSRKRGKWQIGIFDPNAVITLSINMRELGVELMARLAKRLEEAPDAFPRDSFQNFAALYRAYVGRDYLPENSVRAFERIL